MVGTVYSTGGSRKTTDLSRRASELAFSRVAGIFSSPIWRPDSQTGLREKERLSFNWSRITAAIENVWAQGWDALATAGGNGALPAAFCLGQRYARLRLKEMGEHAGGLEYPVVNAPIARFEKRLKIDSELRKGSQRIEY